jgi:hypothetical protein
MATNRATVAILLSGALALAAQPALAQRAHGGGGGHPGGGGRAGAGHAVPRGGGGYHGGGAQARHPQAGTGGYHHGYGYHGGYYGHHPYYGHARYPYHGYYPYYGSSFYFGLSFGSPYYYGGWYPHAYPAYGYYPGYYQPPSYGYGYGYGYDAPQGPLPGEGGRPYGSARTCSALRANGREGDTGRVRLEVRPDDASVYVDDEFCGSARESRFLTLPPGRHSIELVRPGFEVVRREADVVMGETVDVLVELPQRS